MYILFIKYSVIPGCLKDLQNHDFPIWTRQASPRSQTLFSLAEQLQEVSSHDTETIIKLLEELENVPATVELLRPGGVVFSFLKKNPRNKFSHANFVFVHVFWRVGRFF